MISTLALKSTPPQINLTAFGLSLLTLGAIFLLVYFLFFVLPSDRIDLFRAL